MSRPASHPEEKRNTPSCFNCYRNQDKLWPDGPLGLHTVCRLWLLFTLYYSPTSIKRPPIKRPPSIKRPLSKVPIYLSANCCIWHLYSMTTSIKLPRPHFAVASVLFIWFLTSIERPADYLYKYLAYYLNKSSVKYLELNFFTYSLLVLKGLRNMSTMFCTFSVHYQPDKILYSSITCSLN